MKPQTWKNEAAALSAGKDHLYSEVYKLNLEVQKNRSGQEMCGADITARTDKDTYQEARHSVVIVTDDWYNGIIEASR